MGRWRWRWRWVRGGRGMGRGRKREVPKLPSSAVGLVGTMAEPWVGGWFWASLTVPLSLLWLGHGVNDESVSEERNFVRSGNALKVVPKCKTFYTLRGVFYSQLNVFSI